MYTTILQNSLLNDNEAIISGCNRLYFIPVDGITNVTYANSGIVNNIDSIFNWSVFENVKSIEFSQKSSTSKHGRIFNIECSFKIPRLDTGTQTVLERLSNSANAVIVQDNNNAYWLLGHPSGMLVSNYDAGVSSDTNGYDVKLRTEQVQSMVQVSGAFMRNIRLNPFTGSYAGLIGFGIDYLISTAAPSSGGTGTNKPFVGVYFPVNNFVLTNQDYALVQSGFSIFLSQSAVEGQRVIIQDSGSGSINPVKIYSNLSLFVVNDELAGKGTNDDILTPLLREFAQINTDGDAMTFLFANGSWRLIAETNS